AGRRHRARRVRWRRNVHRQRTRAAVPRRPLRRLPSRQRRADARGCRQVRARHHGRAAPVVMAMTTARIYSGELTATTDAGVALLAAAGRCAEEFAEGALARDRDGTFAVEHLQKLVADRVLVAPVPATFGGGDVSSTRDV